MTALLVQASTELRLSLRQGEQLLVSLGIPLLVLVFFSLVDVLPTPDGFDEPVDFLVPGVLALAVMSSAMVSLGIGTGFERQYGVLKRLGTTPLGRPRLVTAKVLMVLVIEVIQAVVLVGAGLALGWRAGGELALVAPAVVLGTAAFAGVGLLMAGTLRGTLTLALANGIYVVLLRLGGMIIPLSELPTAIRTVAELLPSAALAETLTAALTSGQTASPRAWVVLAVWGVAAPVAAAAFFKWE